MKDDDSAETSAAPRPRRLGFMAGRIAVPADFDTMAAAEIEQQFGGLRGRGSPRRRRAPRSADRGIEDR